MHEFYKIPGLKIMKIAFSMGILMFIFIIILLYFMGDIKMVYILGGLLPFMIAFDFIFYSIMKAKMQKPNKLIAGGAALPAKFARVVEVYYGGKSRRKGFALVVVDDLGKEYQSHAFSFNPSALAPQDFKVYINPHKPREYFVDTRPVFQVKGDEPVLI